MGMGSYGFYVGAILLVCASAHFSDKRHPPKAIRRENGSGLNVEQTGSVLELSYATESDRCLLYDYVMQLGFQSKGSGGLGMAAEVNLRRGRSS